jgi:hypothetical protein
LSFSFGLSFRVGLVDRSMIPRTSPGIQDTADLLFTTADCPGSWPEQRQCAIVVGRLRRCSAELGGPRSDVVVVHWSPAIFRDAVLQFGEGILNGATKHTTARDRRPSSNTIATTPCSP